MLVHYIIRRLSLIVGNRDGLEEVDARRTAGNLANDAVVELLVLRVADVLLEGILVLVGLLNVDGAILSLVDLEADIAGLLADELSVVADGLLDEVLLALLRLDLGVKGLRSGHCCCWWFEAEDSQEISALYIFPGSIVSCDMLYARRGIPRIFICTQNPDQRARAPETNQKPLN